MRRSAVEFELQHAAALPTVMVDRTQLEIVVDNLLTNSLDAFDAHPGPRGRARRIEISTFATVDSFIEAYQPERAGCVLTDLRMPGMTGSSCRLHSPHGTSRCRWWSSPRTVTSPPRAPR
jgi:signal transduction histidine kinase